MRRIARSQPSDGARSSTPEGGRPDCASSALRRFISCWMIISSDFTADPLLLGSASAICPKKNGRRERVERQGGRFEAAPAHGFRVVTNTEAGDARAEPAPFAIPKRFPGELLG